MIEKEIMGKYLEKLVDRIFKILPMFEEKDGGLHKYINSLVVELLGFQELVKRLEVESEYVILVSTLKSLASHVIDFEDDKKVIRKEVFKCLDLIKKIRKKHDEV